MANRTVRGFKYHDNESGTGPKQIVRPVADDYATQLVRGDLVTRVSTGYCERFVGSEGTQTDILGMMTGVKQYWDGAELKRGWRLPASTSYDTNLERQSLIEIIQAQGSRFVADADTAEGASFDTQAEMIALLGENVDGINESVTGNFPTAILDISSHNTTATLQWRLDAFAPDIDLDFTTTLRMKFVTTCNRAQHPDANDTGV